MRLGKLIPGTVHGILSQGKTLRGLMRSSGSALVVESVGMDHVIPVAASLPLSLSFFGTPWMNLLWSGVSGSPSSIVVERSQDAGTTWSQIATLKASVNAYADMAPVPSAMYRIRAAGVEEYSLPQMAMPPTAPTIVSIGVSGTSATITWTDTNIGATGMLVERSTNFFDWTQIASLAGSARVYIDSLMPAQVVAYRVRAVTASGQSPASNPELAIQHLLHWYSPPRLSSSNGSTVTSIPDRAGGSALSGSGVFTAGAIGSRAGVSGSFAVNVSSQINPPYTVVVVQTLDSPPYASAHQNLYQDSSVLTRCLLDNNGYTLYSNGTVCGPVIYTTPCLHVDLWNDGASLVYQNGVKATTGSTVSGAHIATGSFTFLNQSDGHGTNYLGDMLIITAALTASETACLSAYFSWYYGLSMTVGAGVQVAPSESQVIIPTLQTLEFTPVALGLTGSTWYVSPTGASTNAGTLSSPWDLKSVLKGQQTAIHAGDTILLRGGTYGPYPQTIPPAFHFQTQFHYGYPVQLSGTSTNYIKIAAYPGEQPVIDGGINIGGNDDGTPGTYTGQGYLLFQGLEVTDSSPRVDPNSYLTVPDDTGTDPRRPYGININQGTGIIFADCYLYNLSQALSIFDSTATQIHDTVISNTGWIENNSADGAAVPGLGYHGHDIYTHNGPGGPQKLFSGLIFAGNYAQHDDYCFHAYTEGGYLQSYGMYGNVFTQSGGVAQQSIIGAANSTGGLWDIRNNVAFGHSVQIGYGTHGAPNAPNTISGNTAGGVGGAFNIGPNVAGYTTTGSINISNSGLCNLAVLRPHTYDSNRATLSLFGTGAQSVWVNLSGFLSVGDAYSLLNPTDQWGTPVMSGTYTGAPLSVPMSGAQFKCFVVKKIPVS